MEKKVAIVAFGVTLVATIMVGMNDSVTSLSLLIAIAAGIVISSITRDATDGIVFTAAVFCGTVIAPLIFRITT